MSKRNRDLKNLHPVLREKIEHLTRRLKDENNPLRLFEGFRTPQRQSYLYSKGRTRPNTSKVTNANAWQSLHQYGAACDFVLFIDGHWSWETSGEYKQHWNRYHELAREFGLRPLSWEKPHIELVDQTWRGLHAGNYPVGGDLDWAENLEAAILGWSGNSSSPALPSNLPIRPPLDLDDVREIEENNNITLSNSYRVNARRGLRLRTGPDIAFDVIDTLKNGQIVYCLSKRDDWCLLDLEGDGRADGFSHKDFLIRTH